MPRPMWTGSLSFGLVNVPVQLVSATRDRDVRFHQVRAGNGERIEMRRVVADSDDEVAWDEMARGWETEDGEIVVLTEEDFAAAAPEKTRTIDIDLFVDLDEIDPIFFNHPYWLLPVGEGEGPARAYRLLRDVMAKADQVAIGRIVMRAKEQLVAVREQHGLLSLTTMRFADEIRDPQGTGAIPDGEASAPTEEEVDDAVALIEEMTAEWDPDQYEDRHRARLLALVDEKRKSGQVRIPEPEPEPEPQRASKDLLAALEESLAKARGDKKVPGTRSPAKRGAVGSTDKTPRGRAKAKRD
ncbi:non-homologous end joining protein Ku [Patulibacter defluvii]|uniref:non-homologous end joining protein Ku n=1 Tax=Patulibacter defluvii TaxID=3095358 RepID=UPI002A756323|nr:Ku protein [Patulibacter sp. DM4]